MNMILGYGAVAALFLVIVLILEGTRRRDTTFTDYATAGRSFGALVSTMAFLNTWLPGAVFIAFAGLTAGFGVLGYYSMLYSLLAVAMMFVLARPVHMWGKRHDLRTQADLLGTRYASRAVRVVAAVIGIVASFPWVVLGMQSLALVFEYLSFGRVEGNVAVLIGVGVIAVRQVWTVRFGMRGVMISDLVQGFVAYVLGGAVALGLLVWLLGHGHGFSEVPPAMYYLPGPDSPVGGLYAASIILTGALGAWCWPDIFVRLFTSRSVRVIQRSAVVAAPALLVFDLILTTLCLVATSYPGVADAPDRVWFTVAQIGGPALVILAGLCVVAATMGNVGANMQALGTSTANDVIAVARGDRPDSPGVARAAVGVITVLAAIGASLTVGTTAGLVTLALVSYAGICQLAPTLLLGIFWRRGTAAAAVTSMVVGFGLAAVLQWKYPLSIPALGGLTSGAVALLVNAAIYVVVSLLRPQAAAERGRVDELFDAVHDDQPVREGAAA